jgi:hypothetical protein
VIGRHVTGRSAPIAPRVIGPTKWQKSLWWQRAQQVSNSRAAIHAAAGICAELWTRLDPDGIREELYRCSDVRQERGSLFSDLPALFGGIQPRVPADRRDPWGKSQTAIGDRHAWPTLRPTEIVYGDARHARSASTVALVSGCCSPRTRTESATTVSKRAIASPERPACQ